MVEWLILLVLVPAVVVPVVMLVGFAGCHVAFGLDDDLTPLPPVPRIAAAEGASISSIALTILYEPDVQGFEFERKQLPEQTLESFQVDASTIDTFTRIDASNYRVIDSELIRAKDYLYRVRAIDIDGEYSRWSALEPNVPAATLDFRTTFEWTPDEKAASRDADAWEGICLVQSIAANRLSASGENVRITLRASSAGSASIERVYISQPDSGSGMDPYDSAADLTEVPSSQVVIPRNESVSLIARYALDEAQPLLVIIDFSASPPSAVRGTDQVLTGDATVHYKTAVNEAPLRDRTGYTTSPLIRLVEKVEVG